MLESRSADECMTGTSQWHWKGIMRNRLVRILLSTILRTYHRTKYEVSEEAAPWDEAPPAKSFPYKFGIMFYNHWKYEVSKEAAPRDDALPAKSFPYKFGVMF